MIGQYLPQTNESATVAKSKKTFASKQGLKLDSHHILARNKYMSQFIFIEKCRNQKKNPSFKEGLEMSLV